MIFRFLPKLLLMIAFIAFLNTDYVITKSQMPSVPIGGQRATIGDVELKVVTNDRDNGDGVSDGALLVNGLSQVVGQGVQYVLQSEMAAGETLNLTTMTYNPNSSAVTYDIQLVNNIDNVILSTDHVSIEGGIREAVQTTLTYVTTQQDVGDQLVLRYVRTDDDHTASDFAIDNITFNENTFVLYDKSMASAGCRWSEIGDVELTVVNDDRDKGDDGVGNGALLVNGLSTATGQGVQYILQSKMAAGETLSLTTVTYKPRSRSSAVEYNIQLVNSTDNVVLSTEQVSIVGDSETPVRTELTYITTQQDIGNELILRYVRTDNGHFARDFAIDRIMFNGNSRAVSIPIVPNLPLNPSSTAIRNEIEQILKRFSDDYLRTQPTDSELDNADTAYKALDISKSSYSITGNTITNIKSLEFVKILARHLKHNPDAPDTARVKQMLNDTVWLFGKQVCDGTISIKDVSNLYSFRYLARPVSLSKEHISPDVQELFKYAVHKFTNDSAHLWGDYVYNYSWGGIDTDTIYLNANTMLAMAVWEDTPEEQFQYMMGYKRYLERFASYSLGTADGFKVDGSGYHHWGAYNNYMYAYNTMADVLWYMRDTSFQIDEESYRIFRDALYYQYMQSDYSAKIQPLSIAGRSPHARINLHSAKVLTRTASAGGYILGEGMSDSNLVQLHNRIYLDESGTADFIDGFHQYNHASAGGYRHDNWVAFSKGFTDSLWGAEIYETANRFGRYQSYGTLEILYPGDKEANGYDVDTWNWNYNPGATTIWLPWSKLHAESGRIDELQEKNFVGALAFDRAAYSNRPLYRTTGAVGMFAMDFDESITIPRWETKYSTESNHNDTFKFRKSNFFFDDIIVSLATGISNNDTTHPTVTTLFQRLDNRGKGVIANGITTTYETFSGDQDNWFLSNYGTGFYVVGGNSSDVSLRHEAEITPYYTQTISSTFSLNLTATHYIGYIDHGKAPSNATYEYITKPNTDSPGMEALAQAIQNGEKPYTVQHKDNAAHIVTYNSTDTWAYAIFEPTDNLIVSPYIRSVDSPVLLMHRYDLADNQLLLSIANPDLEIGGPRSLTATPARSVTLTLKGSWDLADADAEVEIIATTPTETTLRFELRDGLPNEIRLTDLTRFGCTAISASSHDGNVPSNTLDGDLDTRWSASGNGQYIQYCLEEPVILSCLDMAFLGGDTRKATFDIEISSDGTNWTRVLADEESSGSTLDLEQYPFDPIIAKKIRVVGHGNSKNMWNSFTEVNWLDRCSTPLVDSGDVNCDGIANSVDALFILQYDIGTRESSDQCPEMRQERTLYVPACDVSGDSVCGSVDALFILRCEIGKHNVFCPVP